MNIAHICMIVAALLPIVCAGIAKAGRFGVPTSQGGYDNRNPRAWLAQQEGRRARANAAQANSFEALPLFLAGVLVAQQTGARPAVVDALAVAFVLLRVGYIACYLANRDLLRSTVWMAGVGVSVALFFAARF
ncbi:MAG: hypothetical protein RJA10_4576 [Pseudomonadota bacterium]|jgi:uncharacterized MAPEG superfamily protein